MAKALSTAMLLLPFVIAAFVVAVSGKEGAQQKHIGGIQVEQIADALNIFGEKRAELIAARRAQEAKAANGRHAEGQTNFKDDRLGCLDIDVTASVLEMTDISLLQSLCAQIVEQTDAEYCQVLGAVDDGNGESTVSFCTIVADPTKKDLKAAVQALFTANTVTGFTLSDTPGNAVDTAADDKDTVVPEFNAFVATWTGGNGDLDAILTAIDADSDNILLSHNFFYQSVLLPVGTMGPTATKLEDGSWAAIGWFAGYTNSREELTAALRKANWGTGITLTRLIETTPEFVGALKLRPWEDQKPAGAMRFSLATNKPVSFFTPAENVSYSLANTTGLPIQLVQFASELTEYFHPLMIGLDTWPSNGNKAMQWEADAEGGPAYLRLEIQPGWSHQASRIMYLVHDLVANSIPIGSVTFTAVGYWAYPLPFPAEIPKEQWFALATDGIDAVLAQRSSLQFICAELLQNLDGAAECKIGGVRNTPLEWLHPCEHFNRQLNDLVSNIGNAAELKSSGKPAKAQDWEAGMAEISRKQGRLMHAATLGSLPSIPSVCMTANVISDAIGLLAGSALASLFGGSLGGGSSSKRLTTQASSGVVEIAITSTNSTAVYGMRKRLQELISAGPVSGFSFQKVREYDYTDHRVYEPRAITMTFPGIHRSLIDTQLLTGAYCRLIGYSLGAFTWLHNPFFMPSSTKGISTQQTTDVSNRNDWDCYMPASDIHQVGPNTNATVWWIQHGRDIHTPEDSEFLINLWMGIINEAVSDMSSVSQLLPLFLNPVKVKKAYSMLATVQINQTLVGGLIDWALDSHSETAWQETINALTPSVNVSVGTKWIYPDQNQLVRLDLEEVLTEADGISTLLTGNWLINVESQIFAYTKEDMVSAFEDLVAYSLTLPRKVAYPDFGRPTREWDVHAVANITLQEPIDHTFFPGPPATPPPASPPASPLPIVPISPAQPIAPGIFKRNTLGIQFIVTPPFDPIAFCREFVTKIEDIISCSVILQTLIGLTQPPAVAPATADAPANDDPRFGPTEQATVAAHSKFRQQEQYRIVTEMTTANPVAASAFVQRIIDAVNSGLIDKSFGISDVELIALTNNPDTASGNPLLPNGPFEVATPANLTGEITTARLIVIILGLRDSFDSQKQIDLLAAIAAAISGTATITTIDETQAARKFTTQAAALRLGVTAQAPAALYPTTSAIVGRLQTVLRNQNGRLGDIRVVSVSAADASAAAPRLAASTATVLLLVAALIAMLNVWQ